MIRGSVIDDDDLIRTRRHLLHETQDPALIVMRNDQYGDTGVAQLVSLGVLATALRWAREMGGVSGAPGRGSSCSPAAVAAPARNRWGASRSGHPLDSRSLPLRHSAVRMRLVLSDDCHDSHTTTASRTASRTYTVYGVVPKRLLGTGVRDLALSPQQPAPRRLEQAVGSFQENSAGLRKCAFSLLPPVSTGRDWRRRALPRLAEHLARVGDDVHVVAGSPQHGSPRPSMREEELASGGTVYRFVVPGERPASFLAHHKHVEELFAPISRRLPRTSCTSTI